MKINHNNDQHGSQDDNQEDDREDGANAPDSNAPLDPPYYPDNDEIDEASAGQNGTDISGPMKKKGMSWLPIIIIAGAIVGLLLIGLVVLLIRKNRAKQGGYTPTNTNEGGTAATRT